MEPNSLVNDEIEAGADLVALFDKSMSVTVAFWAKLADASQWYLYIASDRIDAVGLDEGYREVHRLTQENPGLDLFRVKLIPPDHPLALAALEACRRFPGGRRPVRFQEKVVDALFVEEAYVYPVSLLAPSA